MESKRGGFGIGELGRTPASTPADNAEAQQITRRQMPAPDYPKGRRLSCGHIVYYRSHVLSASLGSSCQDCYDRMSE
jgi:hypothetical protein